MAPDLAVDPLGPLGARTCSRWRRCCYPDAAACALGFVAGTDPRGRRLVTATLPSPEPVRSLQGGPGGASGDGRDGHRPRLWRLCSRQLRPGRAERAAGRPGGAAWGPVLCPPVLLCDRVSPTQSSRTWQCQPAFSGDFGVSSSQPSPAARPQGGRVALCP